MKKGTFLEYVKMLLLVFIGSVGFAGFIINSMNETDKMKLYNLVNEVMEKKEENKVYKSTGRPLTEKELKDHEKAFTDIEDSINALYKRGRKVERKQ